MRWACPSMFHTAARLFFVEKKNDGLRPCIDYRDFNAIAPFCSLWDNMSSWTCETWKMWILLYHCSTTRTTSTLSTQRDWPCKRPDGNYFSHGSTLQLIIGQAPKTARWTPCHAPQPCSTTKPILPPFRHHSAGTWSNFKSTTVGDAASWMSPIETVCGSILFTRWIKDVREFINAWTICTQSNNPRQPTAGS